MSIWRQDLTVQDMNALNKGTMGEFMGIDFIEIGEDYLIAEMPVEDKVKQPFGLLHGGASVALAETVGSVASWAIVNADRFIGVGIEINANHLKAVTHGKVKCICKGVKTDGKLHIWDIRLYNALGELSCICRFTTMVVPKPI